MTVSSLFFGESFDTRSLPVMKLVNSVTGDLAPQHPTGYLLRLRFLDVAVGVLRHKMGEGCSWFSAGVGTGKFEVRNFGSAAFL